MKLLINLCAHDGIISHYTGVGTMVKRYIKAISDIKNKNINITLNLFTPEYNKDSFGFSENTKQYHQNLNCNIIQVSNGSDATINYGTPKHWKTLSQNTADIINKVVNNYDKIITIAHDTPYAGILKMLKDNNTHKKVWIPHSTIKIHQVDSAIENSQQFYNDRLKWEQGTIDFINKNQNCFLVAIGDFILQHLINEYRLNCDKSIMVKNGEFLSEKTKKASISNHELFDKLKHNKNILLSFGRAESYKNLESTMILGQELNIKTVVIAQSYFPTQPILEQYRKLAKQTNTTLFIDPPFDFCKQILYNFKGKIILLVPSKKEIMGLIINEVRRLNKNNILIVSNNIDGLKEQIHDTQDGLLVDLENVKDSANKIKQFFNKKNMQILNKNAQITLKKYYNFEINFKQFFNKLMEV